MGELLGGALVAGAGSLANSLIGNSLGYDQSVKLMKLQAQLNQSAIDAQNRYNDPINQMTRLTNAGLNKNLVYGNGQVVGNTSNAANVNAVNRSVPFDTGITQAVQQYQQMKQIDQGVKESSARVDKLKAETLSQLTDNAWKTGTLDARIKMESQDLANKILQGNKLQEETNNLVIQAQNLAEQTKSIMATTRLTEEKAASEVIHRKLMGQQISESESRIIMNDMNCRLIMEKIANVKADTNYKELAYEIQKTLYNTDKAGAQWLEEHPNIAVVVSLLERLLGDYKNVK